PDQAAQSMSSQDEIPPALRRFLIADPGDGDDEVLDVTQAAARLDEPPESIERWIKDNRLLAWRNDRGLRQPKALSVFRWTLPTRSTHPGAVLLHQLGTFRGRKNSATSGVAGPKRTACPPPIQPWNPPGESCGLGEWSEPEPDLLLLKPNRMTTSEHIRAPTMCCYLSRSQMPTLRFEFGGKYARCM